MIARLKNWFEKADDFLRRNRLYLRPSLFVVFLIGSGVAIYLLLLSIVSIYLLGVAVGATTVQLLTGVVSAASAVASATAAFLIRRGNIETRKTMVKPRIFVYGSTLEERQPMTVEGLPLTVTTIAKGGIWVENVGVGPAILGTVYFVDPVKGRIPLITTGKYTFRRLAMGERIHLPSPMYPGLEALLPVPDPTKLGQRIRIQVEYFDINKFRYQLDSDEEEVEFYVRRLEKQWKAAMSGSAPRENT